MCVDVLILFTAIFGVSILETELMMAGVLTEPLLVLDSGTLHYKPSPGIRHHFLFLYAQSARHNLTEKLIAAYHKIIVFHVWFITTMRRGFN
jgi:hypothetical protein